MSLSTNARTRLVSSLANESAGTEVADAIDASKFALANMITATNVSTTIDFKSLKKGDKVLVVPASAGNTKFLTVATDKTLPEAAVVGTLYIVLRAK